MALPHLEKLTITEAGRALRAGEFSARELAAAHLERIKEKNPELNAYLEIFPDVLEQAEAADKKLKAGRALSPLTGIPLAIKDNILIKGRTTAAGSKMLVNYSASYDATVITKLKEAGVVLLGRTNMDEFAMGSSTETSAFGVTKNPCDPSRVPGGSSGGSAAAVAAGLALGALGSDTGGSIRQPAAFCGVVGLKPTYGAVSRRGLIALASSLDQIGSFAKTVEDAEIIFDIIRGHDPLDSTSVDPKLKAKSPKLKTDPLRIGIPRHFLSDGLAADVLANFDQMLVRLSDAGYQVEEIILPNVKYALPCYYIIMPAEASTNLARYDGLRYGYHQDGVTLLDDYRESRGGGFGREVRRRILLGTYVLSAGYYDAYYRRAVEVRRLIEENFARVFNTVDVIALPTTPTTAFRLGEKLADPLQMYLADIFTVPANIAGLPAISVPTGRDASGLPFGTQLIAPPWREDLLFSLSRDLTSHAALY